MNIFGTFFEVRFTTVSIGRIELWMQATDEVDDEGNTIYRKLREPTEDDLAYAKRSEEGKVRYTRATLFLPMVPFAEQCAFNSSTFDIENPEEIEVAMDNLLEVLHEESRKHLFSRIRDGHQLEAIPVGTGFHYPAPTGPVEWTEIANTKSSTLYSSVC